LKVIIAGSRSIKDKVWVLNNIDDLMLHIPYENYAAIPTSEVVCGMAEGPDSFGKEWAERNNIKVSCWPADWNKYGKSAGAIRNKEMGDYADALVAFWDGKSRGTKHMIDYILEIGKEVHVYQSPR